MNHTPDAKVELVERLRRQGQLCDKGGEMQALWFEAADALAVMGEAKHDGQPIGVHGYECSKCGKGADEMLADPVCVAPVQDGCGRCQTN